MRLHLQRGLVYIVIFAACSALLFLLSPAEDIAPHGIFLPSTLKSYSPATALVVTEKNLFSETVIGYISVISHRVGDDQAQQQTMLNYARQLAMAHGGTTLQIDNFFRSRDLGPMGIYILQATAFRS